MTQDGEKYKNHNLPPIIFQFNSLFASIVTFGLKDGFSYNRSFTASIINSHGAV